MNQSFSTDPFMGKRYVRRRYTCFHFSCDVWQAATGEDLRTLLDLQTEGLDDWRDLARRMSGFEKLVKPISPCLVMFRAPRTRPHIGVFVRSKILHLSSRSGALFQRLELVALGYTSVRYYR